MADKSCGIEDEAGRSSRHFEKSLTETLAEQIEATGRVVSITEHDGRWKIRYVSIADPWNGLPSDNEVNNNRSPRFLLSICTADSNSVAREYANEKSFDASQVSSVRSTIVEG